jgi:hypothetical protein
MLAFQPFGDTSQAFRSTLEGFASLGRAVVTLEAGGDATGLDEDLQSFMLELTSSNAFTRPGLKADLIAQLDGLQARTIAAKLARTDDPDTIEDLRQDREFQIRWRDLALIRARHADDALRGLHAH